MKGSRALAAGALVGSAAGALLLRRRARSRDRVELYFDDGSLVTVGRGDEGADRLLSPARELLLASRA
jgi:hypothetical protein